MSCSLYRIVRMALLGAGILVASFATAKERMNVIFIAVDDLYDWVGVFGGAPASEEGIKGVMSVSLHF